MAVLARHPLPAAICAVAVALVAGIFVFARPQYRDPQQGSTIKIPDTRPAADAAGRAGWAWPDGVPGWEPGQTIGDYPVSQLQPIEVQPAQLAAAHDGLDAEQVRVLDAMHLRPGEGPLAILAAPQLYASPQTVCLAAVLPRASTVRWRCPGASRVLVAVSSRPGTFALVGVARGDVKRVVLHLPGETTFDDLPLYDRGHTWGQFSSVLALHATTVPELRIYGDGGLVQTLQLAVRPGQERIFG